MLGAAAGSGDQAWLLSGHGVSGDETFWNGAAAVAAGVQL